jgi:hypothetical protein
MKINTEHLTPSKNTNDMLHISKILDNPQSLETNSIGIHLESNWKFSTINWIPIRKCPLFPFGFQLVSNWIDLAFLTATCRINFEGAVLTFSGKVLGI